MFIKNLSKKKGITNDYPEKASIKINGMLEQDK